jgi:K+-transporting ATPase ATPase C chain
MLKDLRSSLTVFAILTVLTGLLYPLAATGLAGLIFPWQAAGSLIEKDGKVIGSALIGQSFAAAGYFHGRPSAAGTGYDGTSSGGTNLGPSSRKLMDDIAARVAAIRDQNPAADEPVPAELVTVSASGLDPHISPAGAAYQVKRVAAARGMSEDDLHRLIRVHTEARRFGLLGEPVVNVLRLNLALDQRWPLRP